MKLNHLALPTKDVPAQQAFYARYFGFQPMRGDGFLMNRDEFVLVLEQATEKPLPPRGLHHGFFSGSHEEVRELHDRMVRDGIPITGRLERTGPMLAFFCKDPEGYEVEVRAIDASEATTE